MTDSPHFYTKISSYGRAPSSTSSRGSNISAMASYRTGITLTSLHDGETKHPHGLRDRITYSGFYGFGETHNAQQKEVQEFCDLIDEKDKRVNSRIAREVLVSIPRGMDLREQKRLAGDIADTLSKEYNTCTLASIHTDEKDNNTHVHIILPTREFDRDKREFTKKIRCLDDRKTGPLEMKKIRELARNKINIHKYKSKSETVDKRPISSKPPSLPMLPYSRAMPDPVRDIVGRYNSVVRATKKAQRLLEKLKRAERKAAEFKRQMQLKKDALELKNLQRELDEKRRAELKKKKEENLITPPRRMIKRPQQLRNIEKTIKKTKTKKIKL